METNKQKFLNILYLAISFSSITLVAIGLIFAISIYQKAKYSLKPTTLTISSEGKISVSPDVALINFSVIEQDQNPQLAQQRSDLKMKEVIAYLKGSGVANEDIKTINYRLEPQYDYSWCQKEKISIYCPPKLISYHFVQSVQAKIRDFSKLGEIVGNLIEKGANEISSIEFGLENPDFYQNKAREEAIRKAQEKANQLAQLSNIKLARLINISENQSPLPQNLKFSEGLGGPTPYSPLETGLIEVKAFISLTYEISY